LVPSTSPPTTSTPSSNYPSPNPSTVFIITTIAGTGSGSYSGDNGQATSAAVNVPKGIVIDSSGNIYFSDYNNHRVRKITSSTGIITSYAGTGSTSYGGDGGIASSATLYTPIGLCMDTSGNAATNTYISQYSPSYLRYPTRRQLVYLRSSSFPHPQGGGIHKCDFHYSGYRHS